MNETTALAIYRLGVKVYDVPEGMETVEGEKQTVKVISKFCFETLGLKSTLSDLRIDATYFGDMARHACMRGVITDPMELYSEDVQKIYEMCL